ncbi:MAG TPA: sugar phosphate isomerase/epimerase [Chthoniobacterales bacterium]
MKLSQVAAQLYTVRDLLQTPADIAKTLKAVRSIGYTAVQISGVGPIATSELVKILDGEGLTVCATHESPDAILNAPRKVVETLDALRTKITAYPFPSGIDFESAESLHGLIAGLEKSGKVLAEAGKVLCYHNHHHEFRKFDGVVILDLIYNGTSPKYVQGEPDTFWIQHGGGDPVAWCEKLNGRLPIIHLKDFKINSKNSIEFCEIGAGNLNFRKIIAAAEDAGCEWFVVEQDTTPGNPLDSLAQSFRYIEENLVKA